MAQTLYPAPMTAILGAIAAQNKGVTLVPSQYTFGAPTPYADPQGVTNTSMLITVAEVTAPYQGAQTVYYTRLKLADLAALLPLPILGHGWVTVADFWAVLNANFGLNFVAGDLNDSTALVIGSDGSGSVTLTAQPNSLGWIGSVTLPFAAGGYDLSTTLTGTALPGLLYPTTDLSKPFGELYSYFRDMTPYQADMQQYNTASNNLTQLTTNLKTLTGDAWINTAASRFSLQGAAIQFNGLVSAFTPIAGELCTPNPAYQYVLVVKLNPTYSLGYSGYLFLHYGLIDPYANTDGPAVNTVMLMHFDNINGATVTTDNAAPARVFNFNAPAAISTTQSRWGGSSLGVTGVGNVTTADSADLKLTGDFTIELDVYAADVTTNQVLTCKGTGGQISIGAGKVTALDDSAGNQLQGGTLTANAWNHVALVKFGGVTTLYVNGVASATNSTFGTYGNNAGSMYIGSFSDATANLNGWIEEFRISKIARYKATFTPNDIQFYVD
jgi:hypothetical protein